MKKLKIILPLTVLIVLIAIGGAVYMYNKPHKNVADARIERPYTADEMLKEISTKDSATLNKYKRDETVFQVSGKISSIETPNDSTTNIFLAIGNSTMDNISCGMDRKYADREKVLKAGDNAVINGIYTGISNDTDLGLGTTVMLSRCVIIK